MAKSFTLTYQTIPESLKHIPQPPQLLNVKSDNWDDLLQRPAVAIVGSRNPTSYGIEVTKKLAGDLALQGIVIVSGLAYGVDGLAHQAALEAGGLTIAVLPASINHVYPGAHHNLAKEILAQGGALVSEYDSLQTAPHSYQFVERNRLIAGLSRIVIITEASKSSGSRHTVNFAVEQGRDVMAVPGSLNNPLSAGPNSYIRDGAGVILTSDDVLRALGLTKRPKSINLTGLTPEQAMLLDLISQGTSYTQDLLIKSSLSPQIFNQSLTVLELAGQIRQVDANHWAPP